MRKLLSLLFISALLVGCKKDKPEPFEGEYTGFIYRHPSADRHEGQKVSLARADGNQFVLTHLGTPALFSPVRLEYKGTYDGVSGYYIFDIPSQKLGNRTIEGDSSNIGGAAAFIRMPDKRLTLSFHFDGNKAEYLLFDGYKR